MENIDLKGLMALIAIKDKNSIIGIDVTIFHRPNLRSDGKIVSITDNTVTLDRNQEPINISHIEYFYQGIVSAEKHKELLNK